LFPFFTLLNISLQEEFFSTKLGESDTVVLGKKVILKIKTEILRKLFFQKNVFLCGEKENFEEYSLILEYAELSFPILNNYSAEKHRPCPRAKKSFVIISYSQSKKLHSPKKVISKSDK
jgi:hypothetical protein